jgi:hypothetical protein
MIDRAALLIRALRLEDENRMLRAALREQHAIPVSALPLITELRQARYTWAQIGAQFGVSGEGARKRYAKIQAKHV